MQDNSLPDLAPVLKKKRKYTKRKQPESESKEEAKGLEIQAEEPEDPIKIPVQKTAESEHTSESLVHKMDERLKAHGEYIMNAVEQKLTRHLQDIGSSTKAISANISELKQAQASAIAELEHSLKSQMLAIPMQPATLPLPQKPANIFEWNPRNRNHY